MHHNGAMHHRQRGHDFVQPNVKCDSNKRHFNSQEKVAQGLLRDRHCSCNPTNSVKGLKKTQSTNPNHFFIMSKFYVFVLRVHICIA